jgi:hypothetical protein
MTNKADETNKILSGLSPDELLNLSEQMAIAMEQFGIVASILTNALVRSFEVPRDLIEPPEEPAVGPVPPPSSVKICFGRDLDEVVVDVLCTKVRIETRLGPCEESYCEVNIYGLNVIRLAWIRQPIKWIEFRHKAVCYTMHSFESVLGSDYDHEGNFDLRLVCAIDITNTDYGGPDVETQE